MNLKGQRFGRWLVIGPVENRGKKKYWFCRCDCGTEKFVNHGNLRTGCTQSCGCLRRELLGNRQRIHGMSGTPEYLTWLRMKQRCYDENSTRYEDWGGRGIKVCDHWRHSFENFFSDMGKKPSPEHSLDRIDNDKGYSPENCRWASPKEQSRNSRRNRYLTHNGMTLRLGEWVKQTGLNRTTITQRIDSCGWSVEEALTTPVLRRKGKSNVKS